MFFAHAPPKARQMAFSGTSPTETLTIELKRGRKKKEKTRTDCRKII
jgi:hypothetical protein